MYGQSLVQRRNCMMILMNFTTTDEDWWTAFRMKLPNLRWLQENIEIFWNSSNSWILWIPRRLREFTALAMTTFMATIFSHFELANILPQSYNLLKIILHPTACVCMHIRISVCITTAKMCVDAHVASSSSQTFVLTIRNVLVCFCVYILLGQTKVNDVDDAVSVIRMSANQKILWLYITED